MMRKRKTERLLTEVELEMMNVIWKQNPCTIRSVVDQLPKERKLAYTSVATMMRILEQKGFLSSESKEKTHVFHPLVGKEEYESRTLHHVAEKLFEGSPSSMVMKLLDEASLSREELMEIQKLLKERMKS